MFIGFADPSMRLTNPIYFCCSSQANLRSNNRLMVTTRCGIICKINISKQLPINISTQLPITRFGFKSIDVGLPKSMTNCTLGQAWSTLAYLFKDRNTTLTKKRKVDDTKSERDSDIWRGHKQLYYWIEKTRSSKNKKMPMMKINGTMISINEGEIAIYSNIS